MSPVTSWNDLMAESKVEAVKFAPLTPDTYSFVVKDVAKVGQTGKGHPKFTINPSVEAGERTNARIWHDFNVTEKPGANARYFFEPLAALGLNESFFASNPSPEQIGQALQGRRFTAEVYEELGNDGVTRPKLRSFAQAVGSAPANGALPGMGGPTMAAQPLPAASAAVAQPAPAMPAATAAAASPWDGVNTGAAPAAPVVGFNNSVPAPPVF